MAIHNADTIHTTLAPNRLQGKALLATHRRNLKVTTIALEACNISPETNISELSMEAIQEYVRMRDIVRRALIKHESEV